jgi:hypothetical protein
MKETGKYSCGIGDRFLHQGKAQLEALMKASDTLGIKITPVWNKSNREHNIVHSGCVRENIYDRHIIPLFTH